MRVGVIQASSQTGKNNVLYETVLKNAKQHEVVNFGCFPNEKETYSYVDISIEIGLLIASGAIVFISVRNRISDGRCRKEKKRCSAVKEYEETGKCAISVIFTKH